MIIKRRFRPLKIAQYVKKELFLSFSTSVIAYFVFTKELVTFSLPFSITATLGSALAIFIAFRNNSAYSRWWEARTLWGGIVNNSRIFVREMSAFVNNAQAKGRITEAEATQYKTELGHRQIAFAHVLRLQLRGQNNWEEVEHLLTHDEFERLKKFNNKANMVLHIQTRRVEDGSRQRIFTPFDYATLEAKLTELANLQGGCERIKNTPLLRHYDYFTRLFLDTFIIILPFSLWKDVLSLGLDMGLVPLCLLVSFVFASMNRIGEMVEDPFENRVADVPLSAICNTIERDLREQLGETELPDKLTPHGGFLY